MKLKIKLSVLLTAIVIITGFVMPYTGAWFNTSASGTEGIITTSSISGSLEVEFDQLGIPGESIISEEDIIMTNLGKGDFYYQVSFASTQATNINLIKELSLTDAGGNPSALKFIDGNYYGKLTLSDETANLGRLQITFKGEEIAPGTDGNDFQGFPFNIATTFKICQVNDAAAKEFFGIENLSTQLQP